MQVKQKTYAVSIKIQDKKIGYAINIQACSLDVAAVEAEKFLKENTSFNIYELSDKQAQEIEERACK